MLTVSNLLTNKLEEIQVTCKILHIDVVVECTYNPQLLRHTTIRFKNKLYPTCDISVKMVLLSAFQ